MKLLITTIAAVLLVGCGESQQSAPAPEAKPKPPTAKAPVISIHDAAENGFIEAVKQHLDAGTDVNAKDSARWTPLHYAAVRGHKEIVELLLASGADVNAKDESESTPLHSAAYRGRTIIADLLIAKGADVNAKDDNPGGTPLHSAANGGQKEIAELLIAKGADVNAQNDYGETPLDYDAWFNSETEIADLLREHGGKHGVINGAAAGGDIEAVKEFLVAGTDVNAKDAAGMTPLDWASSRKHPETADLLRKHGGKTKKELTAAEPVPEAATPEPPTAKVPDISFHIAAMQGNLEAVKQHIAAGVDVNAKLVDEMTPLLFAAGHGHKEIAELLIAEGADVNAKDKPGFTPLHIAAREGHKEITELLIAAGADVNAKNKYSATPLDIAIELQHPEIADLLRKHGGKTAEEVKAEGK